MARSIYTGALSALILAALTACGGGGGDSGTPGNGGTGGNNGGTGGTGGTAGNCAALASGDYRYIDMNGTDPLRSYVVKIDAASLTATLPSTATYALGSSGACSFTVPGGSMLVSSAGVIVDRRDTGSGTRLTLGVPSQTAAVADLAGTWNTMELSRASDTGARSSVTRTMTVGANGTVTAGADCTPSQAACTSTWTAGAAFTANADGGFDFRRAPGDAPTRVYLSRNNAGQRILVGVLPNNRGLLVGAPATALTLPTEGSSVSYWDMTIDANGVASGVVEDTALNHLTGATSYTQTRGNGTIVTYYLNDPRTGLLRRPSGTGTTNTGQLAAFAELNAMPLQGFGVETYIVATNPTVLGVKVMKP